MCRPQPPAEQVGPSEDQREERDVELALHRHRPDVLQRADGLTGPQIVRRGVRQLPVLVVPEAGQTLIGERLPTGFGLNHDGEHRRRGEHDDERRKQAADQPHELRPGSQRPARVDRRAQQAAAEEESRERQEHVDAAGHPPEPDVEHGNQRDGDAAQAVEVVSIETRLARAHGWSGWGEGVHGRRPIYRTRTVTLDGCACVDARPNQCDRCRARLAPLQRDRCRGDAARRGGRGQGGVGDGDRSGPARSRSSTR